MRSLLFIILFSAVLVSCSEDETPLTGDLIVEIDLPGITNTTSYALFTEAAYLGSGNLPLHNGELINASNGNANLSITGLLPGNYVFAIYTNNPAYFATQVVAGKATTLQARF